MNFSVKNGEITIKGDIEFSSPDTLLEAKKLDAASTTEVLHAAATFGPLLFALFEKFKTKEAKKPAPKGAAPTTQAKRKRK